MPSWVNQSVIIPGADITSLFTDLTAGGTLEIKTHTGNQITGTWAWNDYLLRWRRGLGCNVTDMCCGRREYTGAQIGLTPVSADFTGTVTPIVSTQRIEFDLDVPPQRLAINYGNMALVLIEQLVLPSITGANSIEGSIESLFGCTDGATPVCGCARVAAEMGIPAAVCTAAVNTLAEGIENEFLQLNDTTGGSTYFMLGIEGTLADDDKDLQTDTIDAVNNGALYSDGAQSSFTGDMYADIERKSCAADSACAATQACQARLEVMNDCEGRLVCVQRVGVGAPASACTQGSQCASGSCVGAAGTTPGKCFASCSADTDCPGTTGCSDAPKSIPVADDVSISVNACGF